MRPRDLPRRLHVPFYATLAGDRSHARPGQASLFTAALLKSLRGAGSVDELCGPVELGVYVTRFWYENVVRPKETLFTAVTRDGTFLIENGKITKALKNFRFNESPLFMLNNLETLGRPVRLAGTEAGGAVVVPAIKVRDFNFTSLSDAV